MAKSYLQLQHTEGVLVMASALLFGLRQHAGQVSEDNRTEVMEEAIRDAIRIAKTVDATVIAEGEMD